MKLKTTSITHINTEIRLGWRISPETFNIAADKYSTKCTGTANEKMRK